MSDLITRQTLLIGPRGPVRWEIYPGKPYAAIVGEAPGPKSDWRTPLVGGHSGKRMAALCDKALMSYVRTFRTYNIFNYYYPGSRWDKAAAAESAKLIAGDLGTITRVILLGRKVADAFGVDGVPLEVTESAGMAFLMVPHPSGLNRFWNDRDNISSAKKVIASFLERK